MTSNKGFIKSFGIFVAALCLSMAASAEKKPEMTRVYMFGFAASFVDSVAYQTDVQQIDSAWIEPAHKFLVDRSLYSLQLQYFLESEEGCKNTICSVFFDKNPRRLQRRWNKVNKRYEKAEGMRLMPLPEQRFRFKAEEWKVVETVATSSTTPAATDDKSNKKDKKDKKEKKKGK